VKITSRRILLSFGLSILSIQMSAAELPHLKIDNGVGQLIVSGQPLLILGGELGNSSAGTAAQADVIVPKLAVLRVNTILMPVAWEQIEPKEGNFDFKHPGSLDCNLPAAQHACCTFVVW
jgi:hypothetical protein